jgi:hypothetical protein
MLRWWTLSVVTAVAAVLFGFDGISAGPRALSAIASVATIALAVALLAHLALRRSDQSL